MDRNKKWCYFSPAEFREDSGMKLIKIFFNKILGSLWKCKRQHCAPYWHIPFLSAILITQLEKLAIFSYY